MKENDDSSLLLIRIAKHQPILVNFEIFWSFSRIISHITVFVIISPLLFIEREYSISQVLTHIPERTATSPGAGLKIG